MESPRPYMSCASSHEICDSQPPHLVRTGPSSPSSPLLQHLMRPWHCYKTKCPIGLEAPGKARGGHGKPLKAFQKSFKNLGKVFERLLKSLQNSLTSRLKALQRPFSDFSKRFRGDIIGDDRTKPGPWKGICKNRSP